MVKVRGEDEFEKLDRLIREACTRHGFQFYANGWSRKTYDVFLQQERMAKREHLARIESLAVANGELRIYDDRAQAFAMDLGTALEKEFGLKEAVIIREKSPGGF
jgi:hypothetical protein